MAIDVLRLFLAARNRVNDLFVLCFWNDNARFDNYIIFTFFVLSLVGVAIVGENGTFTKTIIN